MRNSVKQNVYNLIVQLYLTLIARKFGKLVESRFLISLNIKSQEKCLVLQQFGVIR